MNPLTEFAMRWAQTPSDYEVLIARTIPPNWAGKHLPVLSRDGRHTLYTSFHATEPGGRVVRCHNRDCGIENRVWFVKGNMVKMTCQQCSSTCSFKTPTLDNRTLLGSHGLIAVKYPQDQALPTWTIHSGEASVKPQEHGRTVHPKRTTGASMALPVPPPAPSPHHTPPFSNLPKRAMGKYKGIASPPAPSAVVSPSPLLPTPSLPPPSLPPPSRSPSPSTSSSSTAQFIIRTTSHNSQDVSTSSQMQQRTSPLMDLQMVHSQSTLATTMQEATDIAPQLQIIRHTSLAHLTPLEVSTDSRNKRRKMRHEKSK